MSGVLSTLATQKERKCRGKKKRLQIFCKLEILYSGDVLIYTSIMKQQMNVKAWAESKKTVMFPQIKFNKTIPKNTVYCFSATLVIHNILDDLQQSCSNLHRPKAPSATFSGLYFSTMESYMTVINIFQHFDLPKNSFKATNKENL